MTRSRHSDRSAVAARHRLISDQATRPLTEQRARLAILSERLERFGRTAMVCQVAARARTDLRYVPILKDLIRALPVPPGTLSS